MFGNYAQMPRVIVTWHSLRHQKLKLPHDETHTPATSVDAIVIRVMIIGKLDPLFETTNVF
jgi:hypothetical protein